MSNPVNKLIFNCLVQYGNVALPEVGSLKVEGTPKHVFFSEKISDDHILVTDIIAEQGNISAEEALALYNDWLAAARREDGSIYAEGVGTITPRHFDIDDELHRALNGNDIPVATLRKRSSLGWVWWLVGIIVVVGVAIYCISNCDCCSRQCEAPVVEEVVAEEPAEVVVEPAPAVETAPVVNTPAADKRYNVMVGVFTIKYNARACAKQDPLGIGKENYLITPYPRGLWAVVAYSTNSPAKAEEMRLKYRKLQKDVWVWKR
ncbi:MAG: hypothetical protein IJZ09_00710 [Tidjanibacter sp.]|nr:hypothetical protein [Tidjanibacter sp.]